MVTPSISIVTPTHDRAALFALTERWMRPALEAYRGEVQWIVADDGTTPLECTLGQQHLRATTPGVTGVNSFLSNMRRGLGEVKHDYVIIVEEDDFRVADYLNLIMSLFSRPEVQIVGEAGAKYYHLPTMSYYVHKNYKHASWTQTAFRADLLDKVLAVAETCRTYLLDMRVWEALATAENSNVSRNTAWVIGMKGLTPGAALGAGHSTRMYRLKDPQGAVLTKWIGEEAREVYFDLIRRKALVSLPVEEGRKVKKGRWS